MADNSVTRPLDQEIVYEGEEYNRDSLQKMVADYQGKHQVEIKDLEKLRAAHEEIASEMNKDLVQQKSAWEYMRHMMTLDTHKIASNFRGLLEKIPIINDYVADRPVVDLLQEKIEVAEMRTREVAQFLDQIEVRIEQLTADIQRLNKKMIVAAQNEEKAAHHIIQLKDYQSSLEAQLADLDPEKDVAARRQLGAEIDDTKRAIWKHGAKLRLYASAEERINGIVGVNNNFLEILTNLHANMQNLYEAGQEILDDLRGNLAGLATAAQASELTLDMQKSLESLKISVNKVATLASQTSLYLTQNVERLTSQMKIYDDATRQLIETNLAMEREIQEKRTDETLELARKELTLVHEARALPAVGETANQGS
jgi:hypothetical protein